MFQEDELKTQMQELETHPTKTQQSNPKSNTHTKKIKLKKE